MDKSKDIVIRFLSDTRHFETGSKKVESSLFGMESASLKSFGKMALGAIGVTAAIAGITIAIRGAVKASIDYENVVTNMTVLLGGNAEAANWLTNELADLANRTPLEFQDLAGAGQILLAAKVPIDEVRNKLKNLGDMAQFSARNINELGGLYAKSKGSRIVQGEKFEQFRDARLGTGDSRRPVPFLQPLSVRDRLIRSSFYHDFMPDHLRYCGELDVR